MKSLHSIMGFLAFEISISSLSKLNKSGVLVNILLPSPQYTEQRSNPHLFDVLFWFLCIALTRTALHVGLTADTFGTFPPLVTSGFRAHCPTEWSS